MFQDQHGEEKGSGYHNLYSSPEVSEKTEYTKIVDFKDLVVVQHLVKREL